MLRITKVFEEPSQVTLKVEGSIVSEWVSLLETEIRSLLREGQTVKLDCSGIVFASDQAIKTLNQIASEELRFIDCSLLMNALLKSGET
jgi:hypothetical protein